MQRQLTPLTYEGKLQGSCNLIDGKEWLLDQRLLCNTPGRGFDSKNVLKIYPQA
jgi:hypothetical protein